MENCASILVFVMEKLDWDVKLNIWGFLYYVVYGFYSCLRGNCRTQVLEISRSDNCIEQIFFIFSFGLCHLGRKFWGFSVGFWILSDQ